MRARLPRLLTVCYVFVWCLALVRCLHRLSTRAGSVPVDNIIRESLKQRMIEHRRTRDAAFVIDPEVTHEPLLAKLTRLHSIAEGKCKWRFSLWVG